MPLLARLFFQFRNRLLPCFLTATGQVDSAVVQQQCLCCLSSDASVGSSHDNNSSGKVWDVVHGKGRLGRKDLLQVCQDITSARHLHVRLCEVENQTKTLPSLDLQSNFIMKVERIAKLFKTAMRITRGVQTSCQRSSNGRFSDMEARGQLLRDP